MVQKLDSFFRQRRLLMPKRTSELIALIAISSTLFLFLHTRDLNTKLTQMQVKLHGEDGLTSNQISSGGNSGSATSQELSTLAKILKTSGKMDDLSAKKLNNTRHSGIEVVFFNRVPKVGSQTFMELLRRLSMKNRFGFHRDHVQRVETIRLSGHEQLMLASMVANYDPPAVYVKHVCYTNFSKFNLPDPIYVNLVRDPIERVISWYYYVRAPWYYVERKQAFPDIPLPDPAWLKKDFETCVMRGDRECRYIEGETHEGIGDHRRQTLFFCGHEDECTPFNTIGAMERAKRAVEQHYAVVGVLEDMNSTLTVLENYVPKFFRGASNIYWDEVNNFNRINKNSFKPPVPEHVKDIVRKNFTREIEFYQFCRQRLHKQLLALKLTGTHLP